MNESTDRLSSIEQDTLAEIGNISMGSAATALSMLVNRKVQITVPDVYLSDLNAVRESYPVPCVLVNVQYLRGLKGQNILVIREKDALVIGNLMMGEDGTNPPETLDEIYLSAVTEAMNMMMGSAATAMSDLFHDTIDISPPTTEMRDLANDALTEEIADQEPVVTVAFRIEIDGLVDSTMLQVIEVGFAKEMVQKLMPTVDNTETAASWDAAESEQQVSDAGLGNGALEDIAEQSPVGIATWNDLKPPGSSEPNPLPEIQSKEGLGNVKVDLIKDIPVQVRAVLGRTKMTIDHILRLGPGHIMELDSLHGEPIEVYANDTLVARGEVVVVGEQFGIRVTEIAAQKERIVSVR